LLAVLLTGWLYASYQNSDKKLLHLTGSTMGTTYMVKLVPTVLDHEPKLLQAEIDQLLSIINKKMSTYDKTSELSRFNQKKTTDWVEVSKDLAQVVQEALNISQLSSGAFDITIGPMVNLWGFGPQNKSRTIPSTETIKNELDRVGHEHLHVRTSPPAIKKDRDDIYVDLSAIAKGYAIDEISNFLESRGISNYMVEIGGELRAQGKNINGVPWRIAIEKPDPYQRAIEIVIQVMDKGVATSGDYRNFFEKDGIRYSHVIDPNTGNPVRHKLVSVTVIHDSAMIADALATALLVMGVQKGYEFAIEKELAVFFITIEESSFKEKSSPAFARFMLK